MVEGRVKVLSWSSRNSGREERRTVVGLAVAQVNDGCMGPGNHGREDSGSDSGEWLRSDG